MCLSKYIDVKCIECDTKYQKRKDTISSWKGMCIPCSRKYIANLPHVKSLNSVRNSGSNSNFWKGGVTPVNTKIRCSTKYKNFRKQIMERDKYTCLFCNEVGGKLQVDHIKPFSTYPDLRFDESNCRTLCIECHRKTPTWGKNQFTMVKNVTNWETI